MARKPFFSGNYGSALSSNANAANLIARAGATQGQMFANLGGQIGGMIQQYGLNKEKRNKLQATLEGQLSADPSIVQQLTMSGDEASDKKNMKLFEDIESGDASIAQLERANGLLAGKTTQENAMLKRQNAETQQKMSELNFTLQEALKDPTVRKAVGEANRAEAFGNYANSIASAEYAKKIADANLTRAQTEYYDAKSKAEKETGSYTPGQRVDIEGNSGNKVSFVWTGSSLQPLNDSISQKSIEEAIVRGVDPATMQVYLKENYDYDEDTKLYTFKEGEPLIMGYGPKTGAGKKDPLMEQTITLLGLRSSFIDDDPPETQNQKDSVKENSTITTQEEFDALPSGAVYTGKDGRKRRKP
jgi:hypothetical protein